MRLEHAKEDTNARHRGVERMLLAFVLSLSLHVNGEDQRGRNERSISSSAGSRGRTRLLASRSNGTNLKRWFSPPLAMGGKGPTALDAGERMPGAEFSCSGEGREA